MWISLPREYIHIWHFDSLENCYSYRDFLKSALFTINYLKIIYKLCKTINSHTYSEKEFRRWRSSRPQACNLLKGRLWHRCFPVNFAKFLRTPFLIKHLRWLLLTLILINPFYATSLFRLFHSSEKPLAFCFQGVQKEISDMKWVKNIILINISRKFYGSAVIAALKLLLIKRN